METKWSQILSEDTLRIAKKLYRNDLELRKNKTIYPPHDQIFRALTITKPENTKVVIIGQDPYHGEGQANGLAFSVAKGVTPPPSLKNILRELSEDIGCVQPTNGDLTPWAEQGVLLLNTVLTVEQGKANSHVDLGWQDFVLEVVKKSATLPQPIVYLLWGRQANAFVYKLCLGQFENKKVLCSSHPSPLGVTKGNKLMPAFRGSKPFSKANKLLLEMGAEPIDWTLV